jgi:hypothetical protein
MNRVRGDAFVLCMIIDIVIANHLDLGAVVWLEAYLSTYNHILVVSLTFPQHIFPPVPPVLMCHL